MSCMASLSKQPDLHMLFYGAEERDTIILVRSLSLLEGLKFLVYTGFWRIYFLRLF